MSFVLRNTETGEWINAEAGDVTLGFAMSCDDLADAKRYDTLASAQEVLARHDAPPSWVVEEVAA